MKPFVIYTVLRFGLFLAAYAYFCGFTGNLLVPKSIDSPTATPVAAAVALNVVLLLVFGLSHSVMARPAFKRWWITPV